MIASPRSGSGIGQNVSTEGKNCLSGGNLYFYVRDDFAFDIDETVWLDIDVYLGPNDAELNITYDRADVGPFTLAGAPVHKQIQIPKRTDTRWFRQSIPLERARFANLGYGSSDFALTAAREVILCGLSVRRTYTTLLPNDFGWIAIEVTDEGGQPTSARMGIYDSSGRLPLPNEEATVLRNVGGASRVVPVSVASPWPVGNRSVFYTDGRYHAKLPVGEYELIIAKGPEYRLNRQRFLVRTGDTKQIQAKLQRWTDMASKGWYSGDGHIHYARESEQDDYNLFLFTEAEDLRVANILQMGNSASVYFAPHVWKPVVMERKASFALVPGQEDPRTSRRGHTIQLNIREPVRNASRYLLYHEVFDNVRLQGGLVGYAHAISESDSLSMFNAATGMAIDVPFGLVDFAEIMMPGVTGTSIWFDFLNLGYKLSPTAGTDGWDVPGTVRSYVRIDEPFTPQAWFDGLKKGRTFVTNGPMLEMSINGQGIGSIMHVRRGEPLVVKAKSSVNPDIDVLSTMELIEQGDLIQAAPSQTGVSEMELQYEAPAKHGTWFVLRARGRNANVIAVSGPIYVFVDGESFWNPSEARSIVMKLKGKMRDLLTTDELEPVEAWETQKADAKYWDSQERALEERIGQAEDIYDALVNRAAIVPDRGPDRP